jgi:hypothetical protein
VLGKCFKRSNRCIGQDNAGPMLLHVRYRAFTQIKQSRHILIQSVLPSFLRQFGD